MLTNSSGDGSAAASELSNEPPSGSVSPKGYNRSKPNANPSAMSNNRSANGATPNKSGGNRSLPGFGNYQKPSIPTPPTVQLSPRGVSVSPQPKAVDLWEIQVWWQGLADGLTHAQVRAEAGQRWGPDVNAAEVVAAYRDSQIERATTWVRSQPAGLPPEAVQAAALNRYGVGNDPQGQLQDAYRTAAAQRIGHAANWLGLNDDWNIAEDDVAAAITQFGIRPRYAQRLVATHRDAALTEWTNNNLPKDLTTDEVHQRIIQQWGQSRYAQAVFGEWQRITTERQQKQQEQQERDRGRGGLSL